VLEHWISAFRAVFPDSAADLDLGAFADGHREGYSVTIEVFAQMSRARELTYEMWDRLYTFGRGSTRELADLCARIESAQGTSP
jgi:hypothetical protein